MGGHWVSRGGSGGDAGAGTGAAASKASPLGRIAEEYAHTDRDRDRERDLPSRQGSVRKPVWGVLPELRPNPSPNSKLQVHRLTPRPTHPNLQDYRVSSVYSQSGLSTSGRENSIPDASSICSEVSRLSIQDHSDSRSSVSSQNTIDRYYDRQKKSRRPERESRESGWMNATVETERGATVGPKARLSRPFEQPAYVVHGRDTSRRDRDR